MLLRFEGQSAPFHDMAHGFICIAMVGLASCSPPVMFKVDVDEPVIGGQLTLNGNSASLMKNVDDAYWAKWNGSDAHGEIVIHFPDGGSSTCEIGYVTHGMDTQELRIQHRRCKWINTTRTRRSND